MCYTQCRKTGVATFVLGNCQILFVVGIFAASNFQLVISATNTSTLRQVQVIFRHGSRSIDYTYPLDPYKNESFWPPGYSQLTNLGKIQGYNLGLYLRERYADFIKDTYDVKDIYVLSSDVARTMQTAYSLLAGFYLPNEMNETGTTDALPSQDVPLPWKSVPVHTIPLEYDNILRQESEYCPRYLKMLKYLTEESETAQKTREENKDLFAYFSKHTGLNITSPIQSKLFYDALVIEAYNNMTLPDWTKPVFGTEKTTELFTTYFRYLTYTDEMKRLRAGPLLKRLVGNMINMNATEMSKTENATIPDQYGSRNKKMNFFSGHDHSITGILDVLGLYENKRPPFCGALILELHQISNLHEFHVEIHYRNDTNKDALKLTIPKCGDPCYLTEFVQLTKPFIPDDWHQECQLLNETDTKMSAGWIIFTIVVFWILLFVALQFWIRAKCCGRKRNRNSYSNLS